MSRDIFVDFVHVHVCQLSFLSTLSTWQHCPEQHAGAAGWLTAALSCQWHCPKLFKFFYFIMCQWQSPAYWFEAFGSLPYYSALNRTQTKSRLCPSPQCKSGVIGDTSTKLTAWYVVHFGAYFYAALVGNSSTLLRVKQKNIWEQLASGKLHMIFKLCSWTWKNCVTGFVFLHSLVAAVANLDSEAAEAFKFGQTTERKSVLTMCSMIVMTKSVKALRNPQWGWPGHLEKRHPAISLLIQGYPGMTRYVTYPRISVIENLFWDMQG